LWDNDSLRITLNRKEGTAAGTLYLMAHCRGNVVFGTPWQNGVDTISISGNDMPSGVNHIILLNSQYQPISERLVFNLKNDWLQPEITPDKNEYRRRDKVKIDFSLSALSDIDLKTNVAMSVTADSDVEIDTTDNILTQILLVSDLKGHIANSAYYFGDEPEARQNADLLMMTHGWTRYDIPKIMRGEIDSPKIAAEKSQILTGTVKSGLLSQPIPDIEVSMMSYQGEQKFFDITTTDEKGHFKFDNFNLPDSSQLVIQALKGKKKRGRTLDVYTDTLVFPEINAFGMPDYQLKHSRPFLEEVIADVDWRFEIIDGMRVIKLPEVVVKARNPNRKPKNSTVDFIPADFFITADEIAETGITDLWTLISKLPLVRIYQRGKQTEIVSKNFGEQPVILRINGFRFDHDAQSMGEIIPDEIIELGKDINHETHLLKMINISDIEEILLVHDRTKLDYYGGRAILDIRTKGGLFYDRSARFHFKALMPLGYSTPAEFYSPQYDTPEKRNADEPDLRATIYWKPSVDVDADGKASVEFYTADKDTPYSVVTEGVCADGRLIYRRKKGIINVK
jgi:hypothetical protein